MSVLRITTRDREILKALVLMVRLFSQRQLADHFWNNSLVNTRRRMKLLAANGLVTAMLIQARIMPPPKEPIAIWMPGAVAPDFGKLAHICQERLRRRPVQSCIAWIATEKAAQLLGGKRRGDLMSPIQATHDLGVSAVWLRYRETNSEFAKAWCGEDLLAHTRQGQKMPDAFIVDKGQVTWVIEIGAHYDRRKFQNFHHDCSSGNLPYQIW